MLAIAMIKPEITRTYLRIRIDPIDEQANGD